MARLDFLLQGLAPDNDHYASIHSVFELPNISGGIVASAFMNAAGANILAELVAPLADRVNVYVGVRNDVTTVQAIQTLVQNNIFPFLVDTATQAFIFHPKVYLARNNEQGRLLVGSANATTGGIIKNIEASLYATLDMSLTDDADLTEKIVDAFTTLAVAFPDNVFQVLPDTDLDALVAQGLLVNQTNTPYRTRMRATTENRADIRTRMRLHTRPLPRTHHAARQPAERIQIGGTLTQILAIPNEKLLWKSRGLTRRDLNIPTAANTNPTGSMLLKKGDASQDIDPRSYFRDVIFRSEQWIHDTDVRTAHMERCVCNFRIIIKDIDYGVHALQLSHNSRTDTRAYEQHNSMTQIHWGTEVKSLIAHEDLLGCILYLYAPQDDNTYTLVFDDDE